MDTFFKIRSYIQYLCESKSALQRNNHQQISWFIANVIHENNETEFSEIEKIRKTLLQSDDLIETTDIGAGSANKNNKRIKNVARNTSIQPKYGRLLYRLIQHFKPETIIEVGTSLGISTLYMAKAAQNAQIHSIEGNKARAEIAIKNINQLNHSNVTIHNRLFDEALPAILENIHHPLFVFIDGNHKYTPTMQYFEWLVNKSDSNTVLVFDDIHWSKEMEKAWGFIKQHNAVKVTIDLYFLGIVLFKNESQKENYIIRF
jgi:predicted O-methyltransferase YrrM